MLASLFIITRCN